MYPQPSATANSSAVNICPGDSVNLTSTGTAFGVGGPPVSNVSTQVIAIPDINLTGITSAITVSNAGNANQLLSVRIDSLIHTWVADLNFYIIAPNLSQIPLAIGVGKQRRQLPSYQFVIHCRKRHRNSRQQYSTFNGTYAPQTPFTSLTGLANGQWKLKIVDAISQDVGTLYGWTITLSGPNGITSYSWSPSSGLTSSVVQNTKAGPAATTNYQVTVSDLRGCTATASATVNVNPLVLTKAISGISCNGLTNGAVDLTVTGGNAPLGYSWSTGSTNQDIGSLGTGTYTVTVTDALGCTKTTTAVVTQPAILAVNGAQVNPSCAGVNNGSIAQTITGGTSPYSYAWSTGATTKDITGLGPGSYLVTVTDFNGCTVNNGYILAVAPTITVNGIPSNISCNGGTNGSINITVGGGTTPYLYSWSNGATTEDVSVLAAGGYQVTVTDASGCTKTGTFTVNQPSSSVCHRQIPILPAPTAQPARLTCRSTVVHRVMFSDGRTGQQRKTSRPATSGTYTVTVTDLNGCTATHQTTLTGAVALNVVPTVTR
jgi:subtilisin-like proprotein convertase family protein